MSRQTIDRVWTDEERGIARRIVVAVGSAEGRVVGALSLVRAVFGTVQRIPRRIEQIYDVMPLAVMMAPDMFPGHVLIVRRDATYVLTSQPDAQDRVVPLDRLKAVHTKLTRARAETAATGVAGIALRALIQAAEAALDPAVMAELIREAERASSDPQ